MATIDFKILPTPSFDHVAEKQKYRCFLKFILQQSRLTDDQQLIFLKV